MDFGKLTKRDVITDSTDFHRPQGVAVAPDGNNVYAAAILSDSIVYWDRD